MRYEDIIDSFNDFENEINDGNKLTDTLLKHYNFPQEINQLIKSNFKEVKKLIVFYYEEFKMIINNCKDLDEALSKIEFINNPTNSKKSEYIEINNQLINWLKKDDFFVNIFMENDCQEIDDNEILNYKKYHTETLTKFEPRVNQKEAFERMEKNGLETGIHCQATGCGKTIIILRYIDFTKRVKKIPKVILFTERVSILADLFSLSKDKLVADEQKIKEWKELGIADLSDFEIINRVTIKKKDWMDKLLESDKPTLLVINRAFLTIGRQYDKITNGSITLVLHDECHNTSSEQCHQFLLKCKSNNIPIVGFSATPLRTGKGIIEKLLMIYSTPDNQTKLNLLTDYNMIFAISNNLILPPDFYWYQIESYNKIKKEEKNSEIVTQEELGSVMELLNHIVEFMPNKKIIAWCGTIDLAKKWKELFEGSYKQRNKLKNFKFGIDTSRDKTDDYECFKTLPKKDGKIIKLDDLPENDKRRMYYGSSILFCACKHREGSDIKLLDGCIFLDKVKERNPIPFIQSIGRVLRTCPDTPNKTTGIIIDGFVKENNMYEKEFIDKIIGYYLSFRNLTELKEEEKSAYDKYIEMRDIVTFDKEKETINMKLNDKIIKIHCNKLEWNQIIRKFDDILQQKLKITTEDNFYTKGKILKEKFGFNENTDFVTEYRNIEPELKAKYNLPNLDNDEYIKIFGKNSWFEFLGITHNFYSDKKTAKSALKNLNIDLIKPEKNWNKWRMQDNKLPPYPIYVWEDFKWDYFEDKMNIFI